MKRFFTLLATVCVALLTTVAQEGSRFAIPASDEGLPGSGPIRRYDWFKKLWESKRSGWAERVQQDQKALVFLGDSITQGWGENLENAFPGAGASCRPQSESARRSNLDPNHHVIGSAILDAIK